MDETAAEDALRAGMKAEIRQRRRSVRRATPHEARVARSEVIARHVLALPEWERARTVLLFVSMRSEVQTEPLVAAARQAGKLVVAPRMAADRQHLELHEWREGDVLEESGMMFLQPRAEAPRVADDAVDLVIVPALAADERGHRVGYGKGFYDRLLPRLARAFRACVIFDFELVAEVPDREGDEATDVVVTDARVIRTERGAPR